MDKEHIILTAGHHDRASFVVSVETITRRGIFQFDIIGLANKTVSESKQRILSAISFTLGEKRHYINKKITTLLSPADSKKEGSHFDLPIAISYLISVRKLNEEGADLNIFSKTILLGELTLTGSVLPIKQITILIRAGIDNGINHFIIPEGNVHEVYIFENIFIWSVKHLSEIVSALQNKERLDATKFKSNKTTTEETDSKGLRLGKIEKTFLLDSIERRHIAKRALEISLAGKHHILLVGSPGGGKSLLAKASKELLPEFNLTEANIFQRQLADVSGQSIQIKHLHFREPHHTSSYSEIIGNRFLSGEIVLAHTGILFMDELVEFNRRVLEGLRQPMENKHIQKNYSGTPNSMVPTDFILIGCMNPCDCGFSQSNQKRCICTQGQLDKYRRKINSPLFQRFDLCVRVQHEFDSRDIKGKERGSETSTLASVIVDTIKRVRNIQSSRRERETAETDRQNISLPELEIDQECEIIFNQISRRFNFSKREEMSLLKVARTIADIEGLEHIKKEHLLEASSYKDRNISN